MPREDTVTNSEWQADDDEPGSEHRQYPRLACGGIADICVIPDGSKETGTLVNLSKTGCCFLADRPLRGPAGAAIEVHLKVKGIDLKAAGIIRHIHKGVRAGIEFVTLSERKREQIDELIGELIEMDKQAALSAALTPNQPEKEFVSLAETIQREQQVESPVLGNLRRLYRG